MIYCCEDCSFLFHRVGEVRRCPFCEGSRFRPAAPEERARFHALLEKQSAQGPR